MRRFPRSETFRRNLTWVFGVATGVVAGGALVYALVAAGR